MKNNNLENDNKEQSELKLVDIITGMDDFENYSTVQIDKCAECNQQTISTNELSKKENIHLIKFNAKIKKNTKQRE